MTYTRYQIRSPGVLRLCLFVLAFMIPSSAGHGSPQPSESENVHFCLPLDLEEMQARDSIYAASKQALNLNVGPPRTVRMIYFLPNDRPYRASVVDSMKTTIRRIQTFYGEQMQAHGYGYKTFAIESDASGEPIVHRVDGQHADSHYLDNTSSKVPDEIHEAFDRDANVYLIVVDNSNNAIGTSRGRRAGGTGISRGKVGGHALVHGAFSFRTAAHELGHAFGLTHDFSDDSYIMSYGGGNHRALSMCGAGFLAVHAYFNTNVPIEGDSETGFRELIDGVTNSNFELISSREYPSGSNSVSIRLNVSDSDGLHVVLLLIRTREPHPAAGSLEVKACRTLEGLQNASITFDYDGIFPSESSTSLSKPVRHEIYIQMVDSEGNLRGAFFRLIQISAQLIGTLWNTDKVPSVAFSPDGRTIVAGSNGGTVKLWDVAMQTNVAILGRGGSVAFSPDGTTVAVGEGGIRLWDMAAKKQIASISNPEDGGWSIAYSSDGTTIASGSYYAIEMYDAKKKKHIHTLGELTDRTFLVAFAPDGMTLASGGPGEGAIKLWDVSTRKHIATLSDAEVRISDISSVAFSPDGSTIASGSVSGYDLLNLWDVATRKHIAILANRGSIWSVAFSPDGSVLASGGGDGAIKLWDVATRDAIGALAGHVRDVQSLAFSPDGDILASGSDDNTIRLWDVSEWTSSRTRPQTLQISSGNNQQSSPGSALANPFIVEVRDQNGNPLQGVQVTFTVTAGDGRLSGRSTAEIATTDVNGRATVRLTLGANQGTTVVVASVADLDAVSFSAVAVEPPTTGSNTNAVLSLDLIPDGGAGNQVNDGVTSGTVSGKDTKIAVEVFASGVKTSLAGLLVKFDFDSSVLAFVKAESGAFGFNIPQATGTHFAATEDVNLPASGFLARGEFKTVADVTGREFSIGIDVVTLAESQNSSNDIKTAKVISFNAIPPPATFSLSLDGNPAAGDQELTTLDVSSGSVVPIQLFINDIRGANGFSARFEYDAAQVGYEEFDRGGILPNAQVLEVADTNPTAIDISVVSFGGQAAVDSGLVGSVRFRTTDAFSGTALQLVSAELGRGDRRESITPTDISVTLKLAQPSPDFNGDGKVDFGDFVAFGMHFGASRGDARYEAKYDLDEDGAIGFGDFLIFGREFGT